MKKIFLVLIAVSLILINVNIASAAVTPPTGDLDVVLTTLGTGTVSGQNTEVASGNHGATATGTFTLSVVATASSPISLSTLSSSTLTRNGGTETIPGTAVVFTPALPTIAVGGTQVVSYVVTIPQYTVPGVYVGTITADDGAGNSVAFDFEVTVASTPSIVITESSLSDSVTLGSSSSTLQFTLSNTGNTVESVDLELSDIKLNWKNSEKLDTSLVVFSSSNPISLTPGLTQTVSFILNTDMTNDAYGIYEGSVIAKYSATTGTTTLAGTTADTIPIEIITKRSTDDDVVKIEDFNDIDDTTGDKDELLPGDVLKINNIHLSNSVSTYQLEDPQLEVTLYYISNGRKQEKFETDFSTIDEDGSSKDQDIEIQVPYDAPEGNYVLQFYATSENSDISSEKHTDLVYSDEFKVNRDGRHVVIEEYTLSPDSNIACGTALSLTVKVTNIGTRDLDSGDNLNLRVTASDFGFDTSQTIPSLDSDDSETYTYTINIPNGVSAGSHLLSMDTTYEDDKDDEGKSKAITVSTIACSSLGPNTSDLVSANLFGADGTASVEGTGSGEGKIGEAIRYNLDITNLGSEVSDFQLEVVGADWATAAVEPAGLIRLAPNGKASVFVYLTPRLDAEGTNNAVVNVKSNGVTVDSKTLTAAVTNKPISITTLTSSTLANIGAGSLLLYSSIAMNLLLLVAMGGMIYYLKNGNLPTLRKSNKKKSKNKSSKREDRS